MTIDAHIEEFAGLPVVEYSRGDELPAGGSKALRVGLDWDTYEEGGTFLETFANFLDTAGASDIKALIIGDWGGTAEGNDSGPVVEALVSAREKLPNLRHLFFGELTVEDCEISWISQSDVSPIFEAFPLLETLYIRGGNDLRLGKPKHGSLKKLVIETGGMGGEIVRDITSAEFPSLEFLELWLGDDGYGNDITDDDLRGLLTTGPVAKLTHLGLRDDCGADTTAALLAEVGLPPGVKSLDLSLGALGDAGAQSLLDSSRLNGLDSLDIHFHYVSPEVVEKLKAAVPKVDADDVQEPDDWDGEQHRYVAVSE